MKTIVFSVAQAAVLILLLSASGCGPRNVFFNLERVGDIRFMTLEDVYANYDDSDRYKKLVSDFEEEQRIAKEVSGGSVISNYIISVPIKADRELWHNYGDDDISNLRIDPLLYGCDIGPENKPVVRLGALPLRAQNERNVFRYDLAAHVYFLMNGEKHRVITNPLKDLCVTVSRDVPNADPVGPNSHTKYRSNELRITAEELSKLFESTGIDLTPPAL